MPGQGADEPEGRHAPECDDATRITNVSRPTLSVFAAPASVQPAPAIIVCPGGGYQYVVVDKEGSEIAEWLNARGVTALVLKYRVPQNDGAIQDLQRAIRVTRARAGEWNIDPRRIGVIGFFGRGPLGCAGESVG